MKISVLFPVYNAEKYLEKSLDSILNQTYEDFEVCMIDDGSSDGSLKIIKEYAKKDSRVKFVSRDNKGLQYTLNELIDMASGEYLARMDADDYSYPDRFEKQVEFLELNPNVAVVGCVAKIMGRDKYICNKKYPNNDIRKMYMLWGNSGVPHPSAMIRADFLRKNGLKYRLDAVGAEDYALWIDIIKCGGNIASLDEVLIDYRVHENQISAKENTIQMECTKKIQREYMNCFGAFSGDDFEVLIDFYENGKKRKTSEYANVITRIMKGNKEIKIVDNSQFRRELFYLWIHRAILNARDDHLFSMIFSPFLVSMYRFGSIKYSYKMIRYLQLIQNDTYRGD